MSACVVCDDHGCEFCERLDVDLVTSAVATLILTGGRLDALTDSELDALRSALEARDAELRDVALRAAS